VTKNFFWTCFVFCNNLIDHGSHMGDAAQALSQWGHPVAFSEALDVLHGVMRPPSYRCIHVAIEITSDLPEFLYVVDFVVYHNRSYR